MRVIWCMLPLLSVAVHAQRESKWSWSSNNRNNIDSPNDQPVDRRKFESLEDFRENRYDVNEQTTRKPNAQADEYYGNSGFGFNGPNAVTGNGYNGNGFGQFGPQGQGSPNNFNNPFYGNQFGNGPYNNNPGFGNQPGYNNFRPGFNTNGFNNNFYPNGGFSPNFGNGQYFPGGPGGPGGYGPNRYPNQYNPLGNSAANGVLVGPGGPTGVYGRPPNYIGTNQLPFNGAGGPFNGGFYNNFGPQFNGGFPPNGPIPFNSKSGTGILAEDDEQKDRELDKKTSN